MENCVPIIEITDENFISMWPAVSKAITQSSFIALDCELSGLGDRFKLNSPEIDIRYTYMKEISQEYSIVSVGVSCFMCQLCSPLSTNLCVGEEQMVKSHSYIVQTFNILTLCSTKYAVDARSAKFLLSHGFDFNKQYSHGLLYERGKDLEMGKQNKPSVRQLFQLILKHEKPIVVHNGFIDLMFLYQCFYADLPKNSENFAADLLEMFPAGIYDTKYISEYHQSFVATYLEFVFKSLQVENCNRDKNSLWHCRLKFLPYPKQIHGLKWHYYKQIFEQDLQQSSSNGQEQQPLCQSYKYHGWCSEGDSCKSSHDVNRMVKELHDMPSDVKRKNSTHGNATSSSLAQLINIKKQKIEEEKKLKSCLEKQRETNLDNLSRDCLVTNCENSVISLTNYDNAESKKQFMHNGKTSQEVGVAGNSNFNNEIKDSAINTNVNGTNGNLHNSSELETHPIHSNGVDGKEKSTSISASEIDASDSKSLSSFEALTIVNRNNDCRSHSAGMDAFMTGFVFACDISSLGTVPKITSFSDPKELNLEHVVGKVYLIGKEFPFLVRSSSYNRTSAAHDKIIKLIRSN